MSWKCKLTTKEEIRRRFEETGQTAQPGEMYFEEGMVSPEQFPYYRDHLLSPEYLRDWYGKRPPLMIILPGGMLWPVDQKESGGTSGWVVTGDPPNLTARPSILVPGYHGWLSDGVLSDDLEGRQYQEGK